MSHELFATVEEMINPETLSLLESYPVKQVQRIPLQKVEAYSGSSLEIVQTNEGRGSQYVLKRSSISKDWIMRVTDDRMNRSVAMWEYGLLDRLPRKISHAIVACSYDNDGHAILMKDVSNDLMIEDAMFSVNDNELFLDVMAAMHAEFWDDPELNNPKLGLCDDLHLYTSLSPEAGKREFEAHDFPKTLVEGWELLDKLVDLDIRKIVNDLHRDPQPLCSALSRYPKTLVHADLWWANLGIQRGAEEKVVILDWQFATSAPPAVELAWYLGDNSELLPISKEAVIDYYRNSLQRLLGDRFDESSWIPQLELSLLGSFIRQGSWMLLEAAESSNSWKRAHYKKELEWWSKQIRAALHWL